MRIALVVDNPFRDLPGMVLLGTELCRRGATCYLVPTNLEWTEIGALAPDFALLTNLRKPKHEFARRLMDAGIRIGVLDSEGGIMPNLATYGKMASPDPRIYQRVSAFCSWGPALADYALGEGWYRAEQVKVTGAPRFDFYASRWRDTALRASADLPELPRPIVLVAGSFPRANPCFLTPEKEIESWAALGYDREYMREYQRVESAALREMAAVANRIAARFPNASVVYRPHPFEKVETYEPLLERRSNLHLLKVGTAEGWLLRAGALVHRNSTTAIEFAMLGRRALLPAWIPVHETLDAVESVSLRSDSLADLETSLDASLEGSDVCEPATETEVGDVIGRWFHRIDGAAHERVADAIVPHANGGAPRVNLRACRAVHYAWGTPALSTRGSVGVALRMAAGLPVTWSFSTWSHRDPGEAWERSAKRFDAPAVQRVTDAVGGGQSPVSVRPAEQGHDYHFGYGRGRSVVIHPRTG